MRGAPYSDTSNASADASDPPKVVDPKEGCRFQPCCPFAISECETVTPQLRSIGVARLAACHVARADQPEGAATAASSAATNGPDDHDATATTPHQA